MRCSLIHCRAMTEGMATCLDTMMATTLEHSQKVHGQDEAGQKQEDTLSISLSRPPVKRKRATHQDSPTRDISLDEAVHQRLEKRLRQAPLVADSQLW